MKTPLRLVFETSVASKMKRYRGTAPGFFYAHRFCKASWVELPHAQIHIQEIEAIDYAFWQWNFKTETELTCFIEAEQGTILLSQPLVAPNDHLFIEGRLLELWPKMYQFFYMPPGLHKLSIGGPASFYIFLQPPLSFLEGLKTEVSGMTELYNCYVQASKRFYFLPTVPILQDNWMRLKKIDMPSIKKGVPDLYLRNYIIEVLHDYVKTVSEKPSSELVYVSVKHKAVLLKEYLSENLTEPTLYNLQEIEKKFYADARSLNRAFRIHTGMSILQYIKERRLEKAKEYVLETTIPVKEIVLLCGYNDVSHFIRIFQKRYGVTPGRMRDIK